MFSSMSVTRSPVRTRCPVICPVHCRRLGLPSGQGVQSSVLFTVGDSASRQDKVSGRLSCSLYVTRSPVRTRCPVVCPVHCRRLGLPPGQGVRSSVLFPVCDSVSRQDTVSSCLSCSLSGTRSPARTRCPVVCPVPCM